MFESADHKSENAEGLTAAVAANVAAALAGRHFHSKPTIPLD
jgi:hypothetical protein